MASFLRYCGIIPVARRWRSNLDGSTYTIEGWCSLLADCEGFGCIFAGSMFYKPPAPSERLRRPKGLMLGVSEPRLAAEN